MEAEWEEELWLRQKEKALWERLLESGTSLSLSPGDYLKTINSQAFTDGERKAILSLCVSSADQEKIGKTPTLLQQMDLYLVKVESFKKIEKKTGSKSTYASGQVTSERRVLVSHCFGLRLENKPAEVCCLSQRKKYDTVTTVENGTGEPAKKSLGN